MKKLLLISVFSCLLSGVGCTGLTGLATQLKDDPALVKLDIVTLYGNGKFIRVGSNTNNIVISPDGTVNVNPKKE